MFYSPGHVDNQNNCCPGASKAEWDKILARLERELRVQVLQYAKLSEDQTVTLIKNAIGQDVNSEHVWFWRGLLKACTNQSTWKFQTLSAIKVNQSFWIIGAIRWPTTMQLYVTRMIENDSGMLKDTTSSKTLFNHFARKYFTHDAEERFPWAAKFIKFGNLLPKPRAKLPPNQYWIKSMCKFRQIF